MAPAPISLADAHAMGGASITGATDTGGVEYITGFVSTEEQQAADLSRLMSYPQGRRWLYRLIYGVCEVESGIWEASAAIHFREGRRSVGIQVKNEAQAHAPGLYLTMIQEQLIEAQKRTNQKESTDE